MYRYITKDNIGEFSKEDIVTPEYNLQNRMDCWKFISSYVSYYKFMENWDGVANTLLRLVLIRLQLLSYEGTQRKDESEEDYLKRLATAKHTSFRVVNDFVSVGDWFDGCGCKKVYSKEDFIRKLDELEMKLSILMGGTGIEQDVRYAYWRYVGCLCYIVNHVRRGLPVGSAFIMEVSIKLDQTDKIIRDALENKLSEFDCRIWNIGSSDLHLYISK